MKPRVQLANMTISVPLWKKRKLRWHDHNTRASYMAKTILQRTVKGGKKRDRHRQKWNDNINDFDKIGIWRLLEKLKI